MAKTLKVIPPKCTGCGTCTLACSMAAGAQHLRRARIVIHHQGSDRHMQLTCLQCHEAACMKACDTGALMRDVATDAIVLHPDRCIGCALCEAACPFGHMFFDRTAGLPEKCDLCGGDPVCARFCPHGALLYTD